MENRDDYASKLAWFLTGAVLGASVALLFAPKSGRETRKIIGNSTQRGREAVTEPSRDLVETGREMYERGRKLVDDAAELFERGRKLVHG